MSGKIIREYGGIIKKEGERERESVQERERWVGRESRKWQENRKRRARARGEEGGRVKMECGSKRGDS